MIGLARLFLSAFLILGGCALFDEDEERVPGKREAAFSFRVKEEQRSENFDLELPPPSVVRSWPQPGGSASNYGVNAEAVAGNALRTLWRKDAGSKDFSEQILPGTIVTASNRLFTMDGKGVVSAYALPGGGRLWRAELPQEDEPAPVGGSLAVEGGRVFVTDGKRSVFALSAKNGETLWQKEFQSPLKGSPTLADDKVFVMASDNRLFALNQADGVEAWSHVGLAENIFFVGNPAPAVGANAVLAAYSSGELFAFNSENGFELWQNDLAPGGFYANPSNLFFDIVVPPVIVDQTAYVATIGAETWAVDMATGDEEWRIPLESAEFLRVVGNGLFMLTPSGELLCIDKKSGEFLWRVALPPQGDDEEYEPWRGPLLLANRLLVVNANGLAQFRNPADGKQLGKDFDLGKRVVAAPIVTDGILYFFTEDAELVAAEPYERIHK